MLKLLKFCKICFIIFAIINFGDLITSVIITFLYDESNVLVHTYGGPRYFIPAFFSNSARLLFCYLFTIFVEKWCEKNDIR
jgi:hypothetical protein